MLVFGARSGVDSSPSSPLSAAPAIGRRTAASPSFTDWTAGWDTVAASGATSPRWSFNKDALSRQKKSGLRDTVFDEMVRRTPHVPGPGTHRTVRWPDGAPPARGRGEQPSHRLGDRRFEPGKEARDNAETGSWGARTVPHVFTRCEKRSNQRSLNETHTSLLPSSFLTPGPGAYVAFTTFGAPSGPTRARYFASNPSDNLGKRRPAEKFDRYVDRWMA